jgi:gentisate 1,2-dioxygenase
MTVAERTAASETGADSLDAIRAAWRAAHLAPLWESPTAHKPPAGPEPAHLWPWREVRPLVAEAIKVQSPAAIERRVLQLVNPVAHGPTGEGTTRNLTAAIQVLMPGESARPHRHTMNALRFVLEGSGASTIVDGKDCPMEVGDLVLTPGWTWHEHVHRGDGPMIWLDALDVPLHQYLGTGVFQPGPSNNVPPQIEDSAFAVANMVPDGAVFEAPHSPVFRYPWAAAAKAVASAPLSRDGSRRARYINPLTGGSAMALLDCYLVELSGGERTVPVRATSNAVCTVVEGTGSSRIGDKTIEWEPKDVFTLPAGNWISHLPRGGTARLFVATDRDVFQRLGLLREEFGGAA